MCAHQLANHDHQLTIYLTHTLANRHPPTFSLSHCGMAKLHTRSTFCSIEARMLRSSFSQQEQQQQEQPPILFLYSFMCHLSHYRTLFTYYTNENRKKQKRKIVKNS